MKWITRERVKVDRVACPWLIKKFIDSEAEFLFVPAETRVVFSDIDLRTLTMQVLTSRRRNNHDVD